MKPPVKLFVVVLVGFLALLGLLRLSARSASDDAPTAGAQSWHLIGWRRVGEERLEWEIWGRQTPFFFYERLGKAVRVSHQSQGEFYIPPLGNKRALLLRGVPRTAGYLLQDPLASLREWAVGTPDAASGLPTHYRIVPRLREAPRGELTAQYNLPVPAEAEKPLSAPGAVVLDLAADPPLRSGEAASNGVILAGQVDQRDREGNLHVSIQARPSVPVPLDSLPIQVQCWPLANNRVSLLPRDSLGSAYDYYRPDNSVTPAVRQSVFLVRGIPFAAAPPPRYQLTVDIVAALLLAPEAQPYFHETTVARRALPLTLAVAGTLPPLAPPPSRTAGTIEDRFAEARFRATHPRPAPRPATGR